MEFMEGVKRKETLELGELVTGDYTGKEVIPLQYDYATSF